MQRTPSRYLITAALLGAIALINTVWLRHDSFSTGLAIVLYVLVLIVAYSGGRTARHGHWHPGWLGAAIGALFGLIAGLGSFLIRATSQDVDAPAKGIARLRLVALANSPAAHIAVLVTAMVTFAIISLIVSSLAAATAKEPDNRPESA